ncbi:hypothetical protein [Culicoidibacter larvae]|uniref:Uncharacterized protein n=1 Tax=Culicoidibacter larvae TaxID=2579976 RepID=A0A5R8QAE7_9FIRM|nr:hypothetical protein [Culicoidibacter larvae]TLG72076.1 hypothetical protein FEZ08_09595 [Culicoidibacter larvae]
MFICQKCNKQSKTGEKPVLVTSESRPVSYDYYKDGKLKCSSNGTEIAHQIEVCSNCESKVHHALNDDLKTVEIDL